MKQKQNKQRDEEISKNIKRVLMFRAIDKIRAILDKEKKQKASDKLHIISIVGALIMALLLTMVVTSLLNV